MAASHPSPIAAAGRPAPISTITPPTLRLKSYMAAFHPSPIAAAGRPAYAPNCIADPSYVRILDTTLRDGEQAPGAAMTAEQKLFVARNLVLLGVDVIDAGFPASSPEDFNAVKAIAAEVGNAQGPGGHVPVISAMGRCAKKDIDTAWAAVGGAKRPRICTFIATSDIHMKHKLRKNREEVVAIAGEMVAYARSVGFRDISFGAEDSLRSEKDFLCRVFGEVIKSGATTLIIADTVGCSLPSEIGGLVAYIRAHTPGVENAIVSVHCHNDLGLANANTLAGIEAGAREVEVTINGIGERAGNAALEEVVMAIKCRKDLMGGIYTGVNSKYINAASKMVVEYTGLHLQPHKAIVGSNAFSHESGIHQDGVLKFRGTYEFISRDDIGLDHTSEPGIVLGKLSGRHALKSRLLKLGYDLDGTELDDVFKKFKLLTAKKKHITDDDIEELVPSKSLQSQPIWSLGDLQVIHGTMGFSTAAVKLINFDGKEKIACSVGKGPIDAAYKAIDSIVQTPIKLVDYKNSALDGIHAISLTQVVVSEDKVHISAHCPSAKANGHSNDHAPFERANGHASSEIANGHTNGHVSSEKANGHTMRFFTSVICMLAYNVVVDLTNPARKVSNLQKRKMGKTTQEWYSSSGKLIKLDLNEYSSKCLLNRDSKILGIFPY